MTKSPSRPARGRLYNLLLIGVGLALLGHAAWSNHHQIQDVFRRSLDGRLFVLAFGLYLAALVLTFFRWFILVRVVDPTFRLGAAVLLGFIGSLFNLVIPGAVGGDLIKAAYLVKMDTNRTQAIASMVIDRIVGLLGLFILAGIAGAFVWLKADAQIRLLIEVVWIATGLGLLGLAAIFTPGSLEYLQRLGSARGYRSPILGELRVMAATYRGRLGTVGAMFVLSSLIHGLNVVGFSLIGTMLFPTRVPSLQEHFLLVPLVFFTTAVPLPFGALGLSEEVSEQLFRMVAHPGGALAMMGFRVLLYGGGLLSVCVYLANLGQVQGLTDSARRWREDPVVTPSSCHPL
jgi:uncharacterized membrane protein YbhN (UPF0104 family)